MAPGQASPQRFLLGWCSWLQGDRLETRFLPPWLSSPSPWTRMWCGRQQCLLQRRDLWGSLPCPHWFPVGSPGSWWSSWSSESLPSLRRPVPVELPMSTRSKRCSLPTALLVGDVVLFHNRSSSGRQRVFLEGKILEGQELGNSRSQQRCRLHPLKQQMWEDGCGFHWISPYRQNYSELQTRGQLRTIRVLWNESQK